jgi:hypothetical protein
MVFMAAVPWALSEISLLKVVRLPPRGASANPEATCKHAMARLNTKRDTAFIVDSFSAKNYPVFMNVISLAYA